ncbi:MAG: hypothetical protein A3A51_00555 [Candidatus Levybacteria bacterium RIFCSPLOWO2_01_FULL_39_10]|nr:MAG: hypothetical protein A3A51_00555 [Candidatus Levybacteria bacterium RIFCSPLOWO2_01_FULL_39_10]
MFVRVFIIVLFFILLGQFSQVFAQTPTDATSATKEAKLSVDYHLPYPGILPDNPLYKLKLIRDKIRELFTTNPEKKADFYLLQADKRLAAGILLFEKGKGELSEQTISKGQNYLEKALIESQKAKDAKTSVLDFSAKIKASSSKHREEIEKLMEKSGGQLSEKFEGGLQRAIEFEKRAERFNPEN